MSGLLRAALTVLALLWAGLCTAHEMSMAEVELRQTGPAEFLWNWGAGNRTGETVLQPLWPEGCIDDAGVLRCGAAGLAGRMGMAGVGQKFSAVLVRVHWADGQTRVYTLTAGQPAVTLYGSADDRRGMGEIARAYGLLGVEHILGGIDHLLFVLALLLLVDGVRRLVATITAFTVAHSITLAAAALDVVALPGPPVEAAIALSIVFVAAEIMKARDGVPTVTQRQPWIVAFAFGLLHGLGFAGALAEVGLPTGSIPLALLCFNVGVELGQLAFVAAVLLAIGAGRRASRRLGLAAPAWLGRVPPYAIGGIASFWAIQRIAAF
jgi:hydrogenase/urease accessory protein HupE